jgi:NitT/TauT family transport system substrate-binding protein
VTAAAEIRLLGTYVTPPGAAIGSLDPGRVARNIAALQGAGAIPNGPNNPGEVVDFALAPKP